MQADVVLEHMRVDMMKFAVPGGRSSFYEKLRAAVWRFVEAAPTSTSPAKQQAA